MHNLPVLEEFQRQRISSVVARTLDHCRAVFDDTRPAGWICFRIHHVQTGEIVAGPLSEQVADWAIQSEEDLETRIADLAPEYCKS